jgi:sarcosine oxidase, subunit gamma
MRRTFVSAPDTGVVLATLDANVIELAALRGQAGALMQQALAHAWPLAAFGRVMRTQHGATLSVRPARWLLIARAGSAAPAPSWLQDLTQLAASIELSSALSVMQLAGPGVRELLARGCRLDLSERAFAPGNAAATVMAQVAVTLAALPGGIVLLTPTSTARHLREWLCAAAQPFGLTARDDDIVGLFSGETGP